MGPNKGKCNKIVLSPRLPPVADVLGVQCGVFSSGWQKASPRKPWLEQEERRQEIMEWLSLAEPGEVKYKDEGYWLVVEEREGDEVLVMDYDAKEYVALRLLRVSHIDLHSMD